MPGVDGLRALAVAAVVAYHAGAGWLPGGFLGVDVFFVISGYLITSLLLAEHRASGSIDLVRFWTASSRAYEVGLYREQAVLRASPRGLRRLARLGSTVTDAARESAQPPDKDGWVEITIPIESIEQAAIDLLHLGTEAEVLKPRELRRRLAATAKAMARLNA